MCCNLESIIEELAEELVDSCVLRKLFDLTNSLDKNDIIIRVTKCRNNIHKIAIDKIQKL